VALAGIVGHVLIFLLARSSAQGSGASMVGGSGAVFGDRDPIRTPLSGCGLMRVEPGMAAWAMACIHELGHSVPVADRATGFYGSGGLISPAISGTISDRIGQPKRIYIIALLAEAPMTVPFGHQTEVTTLCIMGIFFGLRSCRCRPHLIMMISELAGRR
jgi:hypothetical protein